MKTESMSCATCPFFSEGDCHHEKNGDYLEVAPDWWCSSHPLAPGQRDRIAEIAMQGIAHGMANTPIRLAEVAYRIADAMMAKRGAAAVGIKRT